MTDHMPDISTPDELRTLLDTEGVDDEAITTFVSMIGVEATLTRIFTVMTERFLPDKAGDAAGVIQWNVTTPEGMHGWYVTVADGTATATQGTADHPRLTLTVSMPNFLRVVSGKLHAVTAVTTGKLKASGDLMFGASMPGWFDF